jgi:hypothetical protein
MCDIRSAIAKLKIFCTNVELIWGYCGQPLQIKSCWRQGSPCFRAGRLGPRSFTISAVKSFEGNFVWILWLAHQLWSVIAETPLADSAPSDHDNPNAPATARSVYVIAHPVVRLPCHVSKLGVNLTQSSTVRLQDAGPGARITGPAPRTLGL